MIHFIEKFDGNTLTHAGDLLAVKILMVCYAKCHSRYRTLTYFGTYQTAVCACLPLPQHTWLLPHCMVVIVTTLHDAVVGCNICRTQFIIDLTYIPAELYTAAVVCICVTAHACTLLLTHLVFIAAA